MFKYIYIYIKTITITCICCYAIAYNYRFSPVMFIFLAGTVPQLLFMEFRDHQFLLKTKVCTEDTTDKFQSCITACMSPTTRESWMNETSCLTLCIHEEQNRTYEEQNTNDEEQSRKLLKVSLRHVKV